MPRSAQEVERTRWWVPAPVLAAFVAVALLLTRPGEVVVQGDAALLADPGRALLEGLRVWDADRALGTVAGADVRQVWPLGALHWLADLAGAPDWVAQRLLVALLVGVAAGGVLHLARAWRWRPSAGLVSGVVYGLSPIVLVAGLDAHRLLPFTTAPWLLGLTVQALRHRGWRHPALFGLTAAAAGSAGAVATVLVLAPPAAWILYAWWSSGEVTRARAATTVTKLGLAVVPLALWWVTALSVDATSGLQVGGAVVPTDVVNGAAPASEVLRGLGRWEAYAPGAVDASSRYTQQPLLLAVSFLVPVAGLLALGVARWRHRSFVIGLVAAGTVLAVGGHPPDRPAPVGVLVRVLEDTGVGAALRGLQEASVLVVLGLALGAGAVVAALGEEARRRAALASAGAVVVAALVAAPLWTGAAVPSEGARDELVPADARELARLLDAEDDASRVLELPGVEGAEARSPLALALDRPHVVRTAEPAGSPASADLLRAVDARIGQGTLPPEALAPLARLLGAGDVVVRADDAPDAARLLADAPGFTAPRQIGDLVWASLEEPGELVRAHADAREVLLSGSGDGIVDAAAAGLLRGDEVVRYSASISADPDFTRSQLRGERTLVVTDTNRARARRWTGLQGVDGFTEAADGGVLADDPQDLRLPADDDGPDSRTVVETGPVHVRATAYGEPDRYRPDLRPTLAADGDAGTAWLVDAGRADGQRLEIRAARPVDAGALRVVQTTRGGAPAIAELAVAIDGKPAGVVALDERSLAAPGQPLGLDGDAERIELEVRSLAGSADRGFVGLAEVDLGGPTVEEVVRMPTDLLAAAGFRSSRYPLALVQTRLRATVPGAGDEEPTLQRIVDLPTTRTFELTGSARAVDGASPDGACRDDLVTVDDRPVPVRLRPGAAGALRLEGCDPDGTTLAVGDRHVATAPARTTGIEVDQLVWSSPPANGTGDAPTRAAPGLDARWIDDATVEVSLVDASPGVPVWVVLGQSFDPGWAAVDPQGAEVSPPSLVDGYANGFVVTPLARDARVELRYVPQNRVDVALLVSALAAVLAVALLATRAEEVRVAASPRHEPLRRIRALTYEGALPSRRDARTVALVGGVAGLLLAGPLVAAVLALVGGFATRREGWRPLLTVLPAGLLVAVGAFVLSRQLEHRRPHTLDWPTATGQLHALALAAVLLLALDVVIERAWRRGSLLEDHRGPRWR